MLHNIYFLFILKSVDSDYTNVYLLTLTYIFQIKLEMSEVISIQFFSLPIVTDFETSVIILEPMKWPTN